MELYALLIRLELSRFFEDDEAGSTHDKSFAKVSNMVADSHSKLTWILCVVRTGDSCKRWM